VKPKRKYTKRAEKWKYTKKAQARAAAMATAPAGAAPAAVAFPAADTEMPEGASLWQHLSLALSIIVPSKPSRPHHQTF
jgi:hypothetical protein